jgi:hypothetical protein
MPGHAHCRRREAKCAAGRAHGSVTAAVIRAGRGESTPGVTVHAGQRIGGRVNFALSDDQGNTDKRRGRLRLPGRIPPRLASPAQPRRPRVRHRRQREDHRQVGHLQPVQPASFLPAGTAPPGSRWSMIASPTCACGPSAVRPSATCFEGEAFNLAVEAGPAVLQEDFYGQPDQDFMGAAWFLRTTSSSGRIGCSPTTASSATRPWTATTSISGSPGRACGCRWPGLHRRHRVRIRLRQRPGRGGQDHRYHAAPQARV